MGSFKGSTRGPLRGVLGVILGGSWVVIISRVISLLTIVITYNRRLVTPLITTHEPPSRPSRPYTLNPKP